MARTADVLVIGGGIHGCSTARRRKACVVMKGSAAPSRRDTTPPRQWPETEGTRRLSSVRSTSSS